jgi:hypothetical protein
MNFSEIEVLASLSITDDEGPVSKTILLRGHEISQLVFSEIAIPVIILLNKSPPACLSKLCSANHLVLIAVD